MSKYQGRFNWRLGCGVAMPLSAFLPFVAPVGVVPLRRLSHGGVHFAVARSSTAWRVFIFAR